MALLIDEIENALELLTELDYSGGDEILPPMFEKLPEGRGWDGTTGPTISEAIQEYLKGNDEVHSD